MILYYIILYYIILLTNYIINQNRTYHNHMLGTGQNLSDLGVSRWAAQFYDSPIQHTTVGYFILAPQPKHIQEMIRKKTKLTKLLVFSSDIFF